MLDIGWGELMMIGVIALIVVGPKDLPKLFKMVGHFMGRARGMAREFQRSMEQAADDSGLKEATDSLKSLDRLNMGSATNSARKYAENLVKGPGGTSAAIGPKAAGAASATASPMTGAKAATATDAGVKSAATPAIPAAQPPAPTPDGASAVEPASSETPKDTAAS